MKAPQKAPRQPRWIEHYIRYVQMCLRHRGLTLAGAGLLVALGIALAFTLPGEFIPADDGDQTQATLQLPPGGTLSDTHALAEVARVMVQKNPHVLSVYTAIGSSSTLSDGPDESGTAAGIGTAVLTMNLAPRAERNGLDRQAVEDQLRTSLAVLPGARLSVGMGGMGEGYSLSLGAEDGTLLAQHAAVVERELRTLPGIGAVTSSASLVRPELIVRPDFSRAADLGVSSASIAETLRVATTGDYRQALSKLNLSERQVPIVVRLADQGRDDLETLRRLPVPGVRGPVPLESVADVQILSGPSELTRYDRSRSTSLTVELNGLPLGEVEKAANALPSIRNLPNGVKITSTGDAENMGELATGFAVAMLAGVLCVYMVLVLLLKDFAQPLTVLVALVLSVPGAFLALSITGSSLSMPSMIGLIMLMGITTKNAILLVDYIIMARRDHGMNRLDGIIDACRKRARPIIMTTIAMGAGMLPVALGLGADASFRSPMAIGVIGGLITSTVLCLLVIPVAYSCIDDAVSAMKARLRSSRPTPGLERAENPA